MTLQFQELMNALGRSVFGIEYCALSDVKADDVYDLAAGQGVFPLVYPVVSEKAAGDLKWEMLFLRTIAINEKKMYCLKKVIENFNADDIECVVLKGAAVADSYYMPECRASGDIDIYVLPENERKAMKILEKMGMNVLARPKDSHHFEARDKSGGIIEVHVALYNKMLGDIVLKNKFSVTEPFVTIETKSGFPVKSLGIEDNLNFLTAHLIKHFVKEGCGIRQITDLLAFMNIHKNEINMEEYFSVLKEIKFDTFIKNILGIGVKYFGLEFEIYETVFSDKILDDVETGGSFGFGEEERNGFYENFLKIRSDMKNDEFNANLDKKRKQSILKSVFFPGRGFLIKKGYTYLKKSSLLYPVAYIHRLFDVTGLLFNKKRKISDIKYKEKSNSTIDDRMKMMEEMGII